MDDDSPCDRLILWIEGIFLMPKTTHKIPFKHWMGTSSFWTMLEQRGHVYPKGMKKFDRKKDWAGPANNKKLAEMIPESILGVVYIGACAYRHDYGYAVGGGRLTRWIDDTVFRRECLASAKKAHKAGQLTDDEFKLARKFCWMYFISVRVGGRKCYNYKKRIKV